RLDVYQRSDAVAVRFRTLQPDREPLVAVAALVAEQMRGAVIRRDQHIEVAIAVVIAVGGAPSDHAPRQIPGGLRNLDKAGLAQIAEQMRRLLESYLGLHAFDAFVEVAVGSEYVEHAVEIVVKE